MKAFHLLFPSSKQSFKTTILLLLARVIFGLLLAFHGFQKLQNFNMMGGNFPDPIGVGHEISLVLAIFGELVCSLALIFGVLTRLALIPIIFTMSVAFFYAHHGSITEGELAFAYLIVFTFLFFTGPGRYSIDGWLGKNLEH